MFVLLGNCATQSAYVGFGSSWPKTQWQADALRYLGFGKLDGVIDYVLYFVPYFGIAVVGASKLYLDRLAAAEPLDREPLASPAATDQEKVLKLTVIMATLSAITVPSLPSLVYLLFVVSFCTSKLQRSVGKLTSARQKLLSLPKSATLACLCYTAVHFVAIYLYQLPELQAVARVSSAQFLGLYSMDKGEGPLARLLRLMQIVAVGGTFMGLCAVESREVRESDDQIREPLISDETASEGSVRSVRGRVEMVPRLLARFSGILVGLCLLIVSLLVTNLVAYPMLLTGLLLIVAPVRHSTFANVHGRLIFVYMAVWCVLEYVLLCIPPIAMEQMYRKISRVLEAFGALPAHAGEQSGLNALYMGSLVATLTFVGWLTRLAKETPTDDELEELVQTEVIEDFLPLEDLELDLDSNESDDRQLWNRPFVNLISHLLVPFALWIVALSKSDLIHAALLIAFLFNIVKPGDRTILHLTAQTLAASIGLLYVWALNCRLNIFNIHIAKLDRIFTLIGLEESTMIHTTGPFACTLAVICLVLYLPMVLHALSPSVTEEERASGRGLLNSAMSLGKAIVMECSLILVNTMSRFGTYLVLLVGLATVESSKCSLINLTLLCLLGMNCVTKNPEDNQSKRWRTVLIFCLFNLALRYAFGAFPLGEIFDFSDSLSNFLESVVGLEQHVAPNKLMEELLGPTALVVVTYFHEIELFSSSERTNTRRRLPLAATELGFLPLLKRFTIIHANKLIITTGLFFSLERRDALGLLMLAALIAVSLSLKTTEGPTEVVGVVALATAIVDYAYKIQYTQENQVGWNILVLLGAHKWPESSLRFIPRNEAMLRYPIVVLLSVELVKVTRSWLSTMPPALKSGCAPEPCHLFWPQRNARATLIKRKTEMEERKASPEEPISEQTESESGSELMILSDDASSRGSQHEFTRKIRENAQTNIGQLAMLVSIVPEMLEGLLANLMPGLLYVIFAVIGVASTNMLSLLYLAVTWKLLHSKLGSLPRDRVLLWRSTSIICALIVLWQYVVSIDIVQSGISGVPSSPSSAARALLDAGDASESLRLAEETKQWLAVSPCSRLILLGHFAAFFIAACQLRMDAILVSLDDRARMTVEASQEENGDSMDADMVAELVRSMVPRQTPTQTALLPPTSQEMSYFDIIFAPLTWQASKMWTIMEWMRYFYIRYAVEWALVLVMGLGTWSRDLLHVAYLILSFYFFRARNHIHKDNDTILRILQLYNVAIIAAVLIYQAPLEGLLGDWYASVDTCSFLSTLGLVKRRNVLGWQMGQLSPDLLIFAIIHVLRGIIAQPAYAAVMEMRRQAHETEHRVSEILKWAWINKSLERCLLKLNEKEGRRKRVEDIRDEVTSLSREVLAIESRGDTSRKVNTDQKPASETLRRREKKQTEDISGWVEQDEDEIEDESEESFDLQGHEMKMRKSVEEPKTDLPSLFQTWLMDKSSTLGLIFGGVLQAWPWVTAPSYSMCYFFMTLAFAVDFSIATLIFPASIFGYALIVYPTAPIGFWRAILLYSEFLLLIAFLLTIPCSSGCDSWQFCTEASMVLSRGLDPTSSFLFAMSGTFMAYVSIVMHINSEQAIKDDEDIRQGKDEVVEDELVDDSMLSHFQQLQFAHLDVKLNQMRDNESLPLHLEVSRGFISEIDTFFQRMLTPEAEYGPSFVAVSVLADEKKTDWHAAEAHINEVLIAHQMVQSESNDEINATYYTLEFVQADVEGTLAKDGHRTAVFRVVAPTSVFCPAAEAGSALSTLQLREAAGESTIDALGITSVRAFHREGQDFYMATLCFDVLATLFVAVFYQSTIDSDPEALVETYYQGLFKIDYVFSVFICLVLIVADGVIYMKKAKIAKVFYHYLTYTGFVGFLLMTFHNNTTAHHAYLQVFFLLKAISFALGARQIRSGFPSEVFTNSLIFQRSDIISLAAFMTYFSIPFMYELRVLLEYACTDSALDLYDWLKLENISRELFRINVRNNTYRKYHPFGAPQPWWKKVFLEGGGLFAIIFSLLVVPFFIFSTSNPQVDINPVFDVRFNMSLVGTKSEFVYPIFEGGYRKHIDTMPWEALHTDAPEPQINKVGQIQEVCLAQDSDTLWSVPPPSLKALKESLRAGSKLTTGWTFKRHLPVDNPVLYTDAIEYTFSQEEATALLRVINGEQNNVFLNSIYPRVWHLHGRGAPVPKYATEQSIGCSLSLNGANSTSPWWSVDCGTFISSAQSTDHLHWWNPCKVFENGPEIVLISSEVPTGVFATFSQFVGGLTGVYVVYILTLASIVRGFTNNLVGNIQHVDLPSTHRLISLCTDIYSARQVRDFILEERLYWLLIRIYRSPAVLFEFTRTPDGSAMPLRPKQE